MSRGDTSLLKALWTGILALLTLILLFLTVGIVAMQVGNTLPEGVDIYFITPKNPNMFTEDDEGRWDVNGDIQLFSSHYVNGGMETTVLSENGDAIIAPGSCSTYSFCMYNNGNVALSYDVSLQFNLKIDGVLANAQSFPLSIRLKRTDGTYLIGREDKWISLSAGVNNRIDGILGASSYEKFTLEILWEFDGNDELDTYLGNVVSNMPVDLRFEIGSYAESIYDTQAEGGVKISPAMEQYVQQVQGGVINWKPFLIVLAALVLCSLWLVVWRM